MRISVIYSFRNEESTLPELISRTTKSLGRIPEFEYEIIFVNDDSTDDSLALLELAHESNPRIKVVTTSRPFGVTECVLAGLQYSSGDLVVYLDADLQDPPELIPDLVEKWKNSPGAEVVYTTRRSRAGETRGKLWVTSVGYWILNRVSSIPITPNSGDFKLITRRVVREILSLRESRPFLRGMVAWIGFKQVQFFYDREARFSGKSKFPVLSRKVVSNFLDSALISFSDVPLKFLFFVGCSVLMGAFLFVVWVFIQKMIGWAIPGWSAIMATILFLGGSQILMLAIMGLYLHNIFLQSKGRPLFIVRDTIGIPEISRLGQKAEPALNSPSRSAPEYNA